MTPKSNKLLIRGLLGAVLVFFLMPFLTLTCGGGGKLITMSGTQLVTGASLDSKDGYSSSRRSKKIKSEPLAAVAVLAAIAALALAFLRGKAGHLPARIGAAVCALSLLAMKLKVDADVLKQGEGVVTIQWEFGFWLALLAAIGAAVVSFIPNRSVPCDNA